jgi:transposase-like protein
MSKRLQILLDEAEFDAVAEVARREGLTVSEWVRQALRRARRTRPAGDRARKLAAVRAAAQHAFPTGDIDEVLAQIERAYTS